eukprot:GHVU01058242.1.p1 GENE.GHVU01058242.1~~GHVU01058242.1.p1  ORF type:complete len:353 (+),score=28.99 GHVU01058242.1:821-1879(+)
MSQKYVPAQDASSCRVPKRFTDLDDGVLKGVLHFLTPGHAIGLSGTCSRWNAIISADTSWCQCLVLNPVHWLGVGKKYERFREKWLPRMKGLKAIEVAAPWFAGLKPKDFYGVLKANSDTVEELRLIWHPGYSNTSDVDFCLLKLKMDSEGNDKVAKVLKRLPTSVKRVVVDVASFGQFARSPGCFIPEHVHTVAIDSSSDSSVNESSDIADRINEISKATVEYGPNCIVELTFGDRHALQKTIAGLRRWSSGCAGYVVFSEKGYEGDDEVEEYRWKSEAELILEGEHFEFPHPTQVIISGASPTVILFLSHCSFGGGKGSKVPFYLCDTNTCGDELCEYAMMRDDLCAVEH